MLDFWETKKLARKIFLETPKGEMTYGETRKEIDRLALNLEKIGVIPGEVIAFYQIPLEKQILLLLALWKIGGLSLVLNRFWPVSKIIKSLSMMGSGDPPLPRWIGPKEIRLEGPEGNCFIPFPHLFSSDLNLTQSKRQPSFVLPFFEGGTILFTSSSSGEPKAVVHTLENHYYNALGANQNIPFHEGHKWLVSLPLYHVGGLSLIFRACLGGGTLKVDSETKMIKEFYDQWLAHHKITHLSLVSTQYKRFLKNLENPLPQLKAILLGGGPIPKRDIQKGLEWGLPLHITYGSTEMASQITTTPSGAAKTKILGTCGKVLEYRKLKIHGQGEILVQGKTLFHGYLTQGMIQPPPLKEGWFFTGDLGYFDQEGYLVAKGRKDFMLISGGENIHPQEIEALLLQWEEVENALVVGVEDDLYGQRPIAFIEWKKERIDQQEIHKRLSSTLAKFQIPSLILDWPKDLKDDWKPPRKKLQERASQIWKKDLSLRRKAVDK